MEGLKGIVLITRIREDHSHGRQHHAQDGVLTVGVEKTSCKKKANKQAHATIISLCSGCVCDETSLFKFLPWFPTVVVCSWNKPISPLKWFLSWYLITATEMKLQQWPSHLGIQAGKCIRNPPMLLRPGHLTHTNSGMSVSVEVRLCQGGRDVKIPVWTY